MSEADLSDPVKRGFYLVTIGHCMECHTPMGTRRRLTSPPPRQGRPEFTGPWGESFSRNITSHKEKGIGAWTDDEIKRAITQGIARTARGSSRRWAMLYARMTDADLNAIVAYLRTVPPKE